MPPFPTRMMLKTAFIWEKLGDSLSLPFAGVHIVEATKLLHRPIIVRKTQSHQRLTPFLSPVSAPVGFRIDPNA